MPRGWWGLAVAAEPGGWWCGWCGVGRTPEGFGYLGVVNFRFGVAVVALTLVGGCSWGGDDGRDRNPANQPGYALPDKPGTAREPAHVVRRAVGGLRGSASFELVNGADVVRVRAVDLGGDLFRVSTPDGANMAPAVDVDGSAVVVGLRGTGQGGLAAVTVLLSDDFVWNVRLAGGAADEGVDLAGGRGGNVDFAAGTSRAEVALPAAGGTQRVTMSGGAGQFVVRLGGDAPVRVAAGGGAGAVTIDGATHSGVAGGSVWTPDGWGSASSRYDVDATAGVSALTVERV
jgi:hypothetical protein